MSLLSQPEFLAYKLGSKSRFLREGKVPNIYDPTAHPKNLVSTMLEICDTISIPLEEFQFDFARSGGPGGQNVNKVNSKVVVHWDLEKSVLPDAIKERFRSRYATRINKEGEFVISSSKSREQHANREDCLAKIRSLILDVIEPPKPRKKTRPSKASKQRRLSDKRKSSEKKQRRKPPSFD